MHVCVLCMFPLVFEEEIGEGYWKGTVLLKRSSMQPVEEKLSLKFMV